MYVFLDCENVVRQKRGAHRNDPPNNQLGGADNAGDFARSCPKDILPRNTRTRTKLMCIQADVYRARAKFVKIASKSAADEQHRELWQKIAAAYEDLARNEEWLSGEAALARGSTPAVINVS